MSETVTHLSRRCPRCGRQLPPDAREGLCAACLLTAGAETLTGSSDATSTGVASTVDPSRPGAPRLVDGQLWGPYRVIRLLGRGGMGEVYEAEQLETGRRLALKVLRDTLRGAEDRARFLREGQLAASISHAHTVYIFGSEEVDGAPAITIPTGLGPHRLPLGLQLVGAPGDDERLLAAAAWAEAMLPTIGAPPL